MTGFQSPDDPSEAPTGYYDTSSQQEGDPPPGEPWYRRPIISLTVGLLVAILLGLAIYLLADRTHGGGGSKQTPTSPTTSTGISTTVTTPQTPTTEPAAPAPTTTMTFPPTTSTEPATTTEPPTSSSTDEGHHHHHHHGDGATP